MVELADVEDAIRAVAEWQPPAAEAQVRWTPGLAFHGAEIASRRETFTTRRGHFRPLADNMVAGYKRDFLTPSELDSARRQGGWGGISADVAPKWSSRSLRSIQGVLDAFVRSAR